MAQPNEDEAKYQKYADECEATKGLLSEASAKELVADGFARIQVDKLCEVRDIIMMDLRGVCHNKLCTWHFQVSKFAAEPVGPVKNSFLRVRRLFIFRLKASLRTSRAPYQWM